MVLSAARILDMEIAPMWRAVRGGMIVSPLLAMSVFGLDAWSHSLPAIIRLVLDAVAGAIGLMLILRLAPQLIGPELAKLLDRIFDRFPPRVARQLSFLSRTGST
jgi:hypothetical protein